MSVEEDYYQIELPVEGSADPSLLKLGIEFGPFQEGDEWRPARLPDGWVLVELSDRHHVIQDGQGFRRANLFFNGNKMLIRPLTRFSWGKDRKHPRPNTEARLVVWDAKAPGDQVVWEELLFLPDAKKSPEAHRRVLKRHQEKKGCLKWLQENYPKWEDPNAYWEEK